MEGDGIENVHGRSRIDLRTPLLRENPAQRSCLVGQKLSSLLQDWWLWELLGAATCLLALLIIVVLLLVYDSCALPDWPSVFTVGHVKPPLSCLLSMLKIS